MALSPEVYAKKLADNAAYKRFRRENDPAFKEAEKAARRSYSKRKYEAFKQWIRNGSTAAQSASQPAPIAEPLFTPMPQLKTYKALKDHPFGIEIATAQSMEEARLGPAGVDRLTQLGVRMD